jgi:precorrin-2 dehydrogenase / sirohydrochlorin ferrochelatase
VSYKTDDIGSSRFLYPVALNLTGRRCVVVGGGAVGGRKAAGLAEAGATVVLVAPILGPIANALVSESRVVHVRGTFVPEQLSGAFLAIAATNDPAVNADVARAAAERNVLVNMAATGDENGDFAAMASVRRGDLLIAVTCGGASPTLTKRLRQELDEQYGPEWEALVRIMGTVRQTATETIADPERRNMLLQMVAGRAESLLCWIRDGRIEAAEEEALACLRS